VPQRGTRATAFGVVDAQPADFGAARDGIGVALLSCDRTIVSSEGGIAVFHRIVVPTDFSGCAREAWEMAKRLGAAVGAELIVCHIVPEPLRYGQGVYAGDPADDVARAWVKAALDDLVERARAEGLEARACLRRGLADQEIVALARDERADLIVIGAHGRAGMSRMLLGSVTDRVVRLAPCPVLTVREPGGELAA
jgi:nucleotide-binding universal stress UspA family protein